MTEKSLFNDDWLKLQRDYWDNLTSMSRRVMGLDVDQGGAQHNPQTNPQTNPWQAAMDQWWRAVSPAAGDPAKLFMDRLLDQGKAFFRVTEQLMQTMTGAGAGGGTSAWDAWNKALGDMQRSFSTTIGADQGQPSQGLLGFWEMPLDNWQRMMSSLSPMMPGDVLRNMPHDQLRGVDRLLSAPGLGYTREEQGRYQELMRCALDYQRALQDYAGFFSQLGVKSVGRMQNFLKAQVDAGKTIDSARELYDHWVSCCEEVYGEEVRSDEYARINAALVNTLLHLKRRMVAMVDENLGALNMPTRRELRTLQARLQENRRESRALRHELEQIKRNMGMAPAKAMLSAAARQNDDAPPIAIKAAKPAATRRKTTGSPE